MPTHAADMGELVVNQVLAGWQPPLCYTGHLNERHKPTGAGIGSWSGAETYSGDWADGVRHGCGTSDWQNGQQYFGEVCLK